MCMIYYPLMKGRLDKLIILWNLFWQMPINNNIRLAFSDHRFNMVSQIHQDESLNDDCNFVTKPLCNFEYGKYIFHLFAYLQ